MTPDQDITPDPEVGTGGLTRNSEHVNIIGHSKLSLQSFDQLREAYADGLGDFPITFRFDPTASENDFLNPFAQDLPLHEDTDIASLEEFFDRRLPISFDPNQGIKLDEMRTMPKPSFGHLAQSFKDLQPTVVCLCGSTRFRQEMADTNARLTLTGSIVLAPGVFAHDGDEITEDQKRDLDALHLRKIDMADEILVVDPGGYVGESTKHEIAYAREQNKPLYFLSTMEPL